MPIEVHDFSSDEVTTFVGEWEDWQGVLPVRGKSIAKLYDLYADGSLADYACADFAAAVDRHYQLDAILY